MVFQDSYLKMIFNIYKMEKKSQNILLLALAGFGIYYFLKNKKATAPVVPPTTGGGNVVPVPSRPDKQIKTPVEPIYQAPIFEERDPIFAEPIYNAPVIDQPIVVTPEKGKIDVPPTAIVESPIYDYVEPPASIWDEPIISDPIYYAPVVDTPVVVSPERNRPSRDIITPVEPIYDQPIYQAPIYQPEPVYNEPIYQPEPTAIYETNQYSQSVNDFVNNIPFLGMLYERDEPVEYDFELKRR